MLRVLLVKDLHQQQIPCRFPAVLSVVEARTVQSQKLALPTQGKFSVFRFQCLATVQTRPGRASQIFFEPVDLLFELADLSVKFRFAFLQGLRFVILFPGEDLGKILDEGLLPLGYLVWMNAVFRTYFLQCTLFPKSFKNYLGLECRNVSLSNGCICSLPEFVPPWLSYNLRPWSSFWGVGHHSYLLLFDGPSNRVRDSLMRVQA